MILHLFYLVYWLPVAVVCIIRHHMVWWRLEYYICTSNYSFYFFSLVRSGFVTGGHGLGLTWLQREGSAKAAVTKEHRAVDSHSFFFYFLVDGNRKRLLKFACMVCVRVICLTLALVQFRPTPFGKKNYFGKKFRPRHVMNHWFIFHWSATLDTDWRGRKRFTDSWKQDFDHSEVSVPSGSEFCGPYGLDPRT